MAARIMQLAFKNSKILELKKSFIYKRKISKRAEINLSSFML